MPNNAVHTYIHNIIHFPVNTLVEWDFILNLNRQYVYQNVPPQTSLLGSLMHMHWTQNIVIWLKPLGKPHGKLCYYQITPFN